jgi:hypothetical protein
MKTILKLIGFLMLACSVGAATNQFDNVNIKTNLIVFGNQTNAGNVSAAHFFGDGSGITGVSGAGGGLTAIGGQGTNNLLASPVITNLTAYPSNTASVSITDTNHTATNLYRMHLGGTNQNMDQFFAAGTELFDSGIWDATNGVWALRDIVTGINALSVAETTHTLTVAGNAQFASNLYLPQTTAIYFGGSQGLMVPKLTDIFLGANAGNLTLNGGNNSGIGYNSLNSLTSGNNNVSMGGQSMHSTTTGTYNTAIGEQSLNSDITGSHNTALGNGALYDVTTGVFNIGIGDSGGDSIVTGSYNIDIGNDAPGDETGIIRIGQSGLQTDTYLTGTIHGGAAQFSGSAAAAPMLTLSNNYVPSDLMADLQGQSSQVDRLRFLIAGTTNWQIIAAPNIWTLADSNGVAAVTATNLTHSIGLHGNVNMDSNVTIQGVYTGNGSGLTNVLGIGYTTTNLPTGQIVTNATLNGVIYQTNLTGFGGGGVVVGGYAGQAGYSQFSVVVGGYGGSAYSNSMSLPTLPSFNVVIGGSNDYAINGTGDVVIGGQWNSTSGTSPTVISYSANSILLGGVSNLVGIIVDELSTPYYISNAIVSGVMAQASNNNVFVWSDGNSGNYFHTTTSNQFLVNASGGYGFGTNAPTPGVVMSANGFASGRGATNSVLTLTSTNWNNTNGVDGYIYTTSGMTNAMMFDAQSNAVWPIAVTFTNFMPIPMRAGWLLTNTTAKFNFHQ